MPSTAIGRALAGGYSEGMRAGGLIQAGRGAAGLAVGALVVALLGGSRLPARGRTGGNRAGAAGVVRVPVRSSPRLLVLTGPGIADLPAGFPDGAAKLAYLERAVRFPSRLPLGPAVAAGFRLISAWQAVARFPVSRSDRHGQLRRCIVARCCGVSVIGKA